MQSLMAILLVVRSRPGPKIVHCYPSCPQRVRARLYHSTTDSQVDDDSDSDSDVDVNGIASLRRPHQAQRSQDNAPTTSDLQRETRDADDILGFTRDSLERLLAPGAWSDAKKFEICIDGLTFVGHPVFAHEDGRWTRKGKREPSRLNNAYEVDDRYGDYTNFGITVTEPVSPVQAAHSFTHIPESFDSQLGRSLGTTSMNSASSTSLTTPEQLTMFNLVFVFDDKSDSSDSAFVLRVYKNVIKKLSKALLYCQKQSSYVGIETRRLQGLYARAKQERQSASVLEQKIFESSELAWAMKEVYDSILSGKIAGIRLNGQAISLQVPSTPSVDDQTATLDQHAGVLLLEDKGSLLRELSHPHASPLSHFIREHTPTKSLQKLANRLSMSMDEVLYLARHLTKWRKARPIIPLHPRNPYTVQPNAPADRIADFATDYARKFPGLPPLPQILKVLSGRPVRYGMLMPSRDHRAPYMEILAYLVQHGFVMQLRTYGWLRRISPRVPAKESGAVIDRNRMPLSVASLLSTQLQAVDDDDASVSSDRTAIPLAAADKPLGSTVRQEVTSVGNSNIINGEDPWDIIPNPNKPSAEDVDRIRNIQRAISDAELHSRFNSLQHYFTGEQPLESIAAIEDLKRSQVERWLDLMQKDGLITTIRHA